MMARKFRFKAKSFESMGTFKDSNGTERKDSSANIYESMLLSDAYRSMKPRQQQLYVLCKAQYFGKKKPRQDFPDLEQVKSDECFYLNYGNIKQYGLYTENMKKEFYDDMKILVEHGFIEVVIKGGRGKQKSVYKYSDRWQSWTM